MTSLDLLVTVAYNNGLSPPKGKMKTSLNSEQVVVIILTKIRALRQINNTKQNSQLKV